MNLLDQLLADTGQVPDPSPAALDAARTRLDVAVSNTRRTLVAVHRHRQRRRHRRTLTALAAVAVLTIGLVAIPTVGLGQGTPSATAAAVEALTSASANVDDLAPATGEVAYWQVRSQYSQVSRFVEHPGQTFDRHIWVGNGRDGALIDTGVHDGVRQLEPSRFGVGQVSLSWAHLDRLPTDPDQLERALLDLLNTKDRSRLLSAAAELLGETPATPELRSALWLVAARTPGLTFRGETADGLGRSGVTVRTADTGLGYRELIFDESTGTLLEQRTIGSGDASGDSYRITYLDQGPAESAPSATADAPSERSK